ncbi:hypothetical protein PR202_ga04438 [Eleusine coracana subsp. coracana]|uniref:Uncharacterized protein n=1 Tax=Eleusine coracana subsp. coracana TaxID=191504 RepID=A0AAV5BPM0_ELECO|nr:hypothetical protein PR202_ga04438 [Eleusine coracana subsp. coracana]
MAFAAKVKTEDASEAVDLDVDIVSLDDVSGCSKLATADDPDATECSSSFGDTLSGSEDDGRPSEISDIEVDSPFCRYPPNGDAADLLDAATSDNMDRLLKKKKVTDHWRKYISPVMWRCQWLELRMKDLQSQVSKYDKELSVLKHEKELQTKMIELDCSSSRSVPFSSQCCRKTMKRRRRKRNELKMDASSYISNHTIFSYFEKTEAEGHSIEDNANLGKGKGPGLLEASPQEMSDCDMEDSAMPDSALSSYGEASNMEIFESTMSLLSEGPHQIGELRESSEDVLIDNQAAEEGYQNFEVISHPIKRLRVSVKRETRAHSEDESVAPVVGIKREGHEEGSSSFSLQGAILKPRFTGKRRERKPMKQVMRRRSSSTTAAALLSWRSQRIRKKRQ